MRIVVLYRPPPSSDNGLTHKIFMEEFASFLEVQTLTAGHLVLVGDFNCQVDNTNDYKACQFIHLLDSFSLVQHISEPTHMSGHTLDLIITRSYESTVSDIIVYPYGIISDHSAISMKLQIIKPRLSKKVVTYRKTISIDIQSSRKTSPYVEWCSPVVMTHMF